MVVVPYVAQVRRRKVGSNEPGGSTELSDHISGPPRASAMVEPRCPTGADVSNLDGI